MKCVCKSCLVDVASSMLMHNTLYQVQRLWLAQPRTVVFQESCEFLIGILTMNSAMKLQTEPHDNPSVIHSFIICPSIPHTFLAFVHPALCPSICPSICPFIRLSVHLSVHPSDHLFSIRPSICQFVCQFQKLGLADCIVPCPMLTCQQPKL